MATGEETAKDTGSGQVASPWAAALDKLREWDAVWAGQAVKMTTNPVADGVLPTKFIELVLIGLNASRTNLNPEGTRRHDVGTSTTPVAWTFSRADTLRAFCVDG